MNRMVGPCFGLLLTARCRHHTTDPAPHARTVAGEAPVKICEAQEQEATPTIERSTADPRAAPMITREPTLERLAIAQQLMLEPFGLSEAALSRDRKSVV